MLEFLKRYALSIVALTIALIVLFWLLNVGSKAPGVVGATFSKVGGLANGSDYKFS